MSRVRTTIWTTAFSTSALVSAGLCADTTEAEIRRLQQELNQLKASLSQDAPTRPRSNDPQWPSFAVFGKVSVDAIYDDKNAGLNGVLGIFPRKRTKTSGSSVISGLSEGITFPELAYIHQLRASAPQDPVTFHSIRSYRYP